MSNRKDKINNFSSKRPNRSVGMTTEMLRTRKNAQEGFKRPVKDLRFNIKKAGISGSSKVLDARSKLQAKRSVKDLEEMPIINLDERRKQHMSNDQTGNRSLSLDSGTIKITAKQNLPPNRSAEIAGKSIVITTKVETKDKPKSKTRGKPKDRNLKAMGAGGFTVTAKATTGSPRKRKRLYADLINDEERSKTVEQLDYYEYKKLKEESKFEEEYLPLPFQRNSTPLAERLDHGPIPDPRGTPVTSTKVTITNLHPTVSRQDIEELFGAVGVLKSCKMIGPGAADVVYTVKEDAVTAYARYHNRNLDGQPMQCKLSVVHNTATDPTPLSRALAPLRSTAPSQKLFKPEAERYQPPKKLSTSMQSASRPVVFKVKI